VKRTTVVTCSEAAVSNLTTGNERSYGVSELKGTTVSHTTVTQSDGGIPQGTKMVSAFLGKAREIEKGGCANPFKITGED